MQKRKKILYHLLFTILNFFIFIGEVTRQVVAAPIKLVLDIYKEILRLLKKITFRFKLPKFKLPKIKPRKKIFLNAFKLKYFVLGFITAFLIVFVYQTYTFAKSLPSPKSIGKVNFSLSTHVYDRKGRLLYEFYREQNRTPVKLSELPPYVYQATIATEDKDFFRHNGISPIGGIIRALKEDFFSKQLQGGSTITQQLVKSALLTPERTIQRKIKEIILALWTERLFTKQQILEMYLNQVPYGGSAYGIEEAAETYFNKHARDLSLEEAAFLAGLPQAPSVYSPFVNPVLATERRNDVLKKMLEQKYINENTYEQVVNNPLNVSSPKTSIKAPHFVFYLKDFLVQQFGIHTVEEGGLRVTTTLDLDIQEKAEQVLKEELTKIKNLNVSNGAILVTRPPTGEILAMVGSVDYFATPSGAFNVTTALRQPGSAIKPLNYAVGIERHLVTPATIFLDVQTCFPSFPTKYCPVDYDGKFHGPQPLRYALGNSFNIPAVKMLAINGVREFIASASAFTITTFTDPSRYGLSLTLGGGEVRMTEMAQAFSAFANRGIPKTLNSVLKVEDKEGKILYQLKDPNLVQDVKKPLKNPSFLSIIGKPAISQETAFIMSHILLDSNARAIEFGPSAFLSIPNRSVSVKTGTTDDKKDNWTIGFTPNFLTVVWVGNNDNTPMNPYLTSGITGAAPIWNRVMSSVLKTQPDLFPIRSANVIGRQVCWNTGQVVDAAKPDQTNSCPTRFEYLIKGTENVKTLQTEKKTVFVTKDSDKMITDLNGVDPSKVEPKEKTVITDGFSTYCTDCIGDQIQVTPTPTPKP